MPDIKKIVLDVMSAVLPVSALVVVLQLILRLPLETLVQFLVGVLFVALGLMFFMLGAHLGLLPVGEVIGTSLTKTGKLWLVVLFGVILGFAATIADPHLRVLAIQVDTVSGGAVSKGVLILAVTAGMALFIGLAMLRVVVGISIKTLLVASYGLIFLLAAFVPSSYFPVSMDAGGVATGPLVVPFVIAVGVGLTAVLKGKRSSEGFGIVALSFAGPILAVMLLGVIFG